MVFDNFKFGANFESNIVNKTSIFKNNQLVILPQYESNEEKTFITINNINNFGNNSCNITSVSSRSFYTSDDSSEYFLLNTSSHTSSERNLIFINSDLTKHKTIILGGNITISLITLYEQSNFSSFNAIDPETIDIDIDQTSIVYFGVPHIVDIGMGRYHSLFVDKNGNVYSYGIQYDKGQLGRRRTTNNETKPMQITETIGDSNIIAISAGGQHSLFLDENSNVYSCGYNEVAQLGHGNTNNVYDFPTIIDALVDSNIIAISAGYQHSLFLDENSNVYGCGDNYYGELGISHTADGDTVVDIPTRIDALVGSNITHISAGRFHYSLFLDSDRKVYSCGNNDNGQLGRTGNTKIPMQITSNIDSSNIIAISAGYQHSLFLDSDRKVYSCGNNDNGQLGHGNIDQCNVPTLIDALVGSNITHISAGYNFSLFVANSNIIYRCGLDQDKTTLRLLPYKLADANTNTTNIVNISANKDDYPADTRWYTSFLYTSIYESVYKLSETTTELDLDLTDTDGQYIDGFIIDGSIYLIHKSGKIITALNSKYEFSNSYDIDP